MPISPLRLADGKRLCFQFRAEIVSTGSTNFEESTPMSFFPRAAVALFSAGTLFAAATLCQQNGKGASDLERKVDQVFSAYNKPDTPGCALGVVRDGAFVYKRGYGTASLELGRSEEHTSELQSQS